MCVASDHRVAPTFSHYPLPTYGRPLTLKTPTRLALANPHPPPLGYHPPPPNLCNRPPVECDGTVPRICHAAQLVKHSTHVHHQVMEDLRERLGGDWLVEEMIHDADRHPCELVKTVGGVDVLLTPHGFQVNMLVMAFRPQRREESTRVFRTRALPITTAEAPLLRHMQLHLGSRELLLTAPQYKTGKLMTTNQTSILLQQKQKPSLTQAPFLPLSSGVFVPHHCHLLTLSSPACHPYPHRRPPKMQSMLGVFLRPGALLFEVFPHKYFWGGYAPMVEGLGVRHAWSMSRSGRFWMWFVYPTTETCMRYKRCRAYSRNTDVEIEEQDLERLVKLAVPPTTSGNL